MASQVKVPSGNFSARVVKENVIQFSPEAVKAPFSLRCGAVLIDYIIIFAAPVIFLLIARSMGEDGANLLNGEINNVGWLAAILLAVCNLIILPVISGRSFGKMITGLTIVGTDGRPASFRSLIFRQTLGYLILFGSGGLGFLLSVFSTKGRALHDYIFGTVVIFADKSKLT